MIQDNLLKFSADQALTSTADSTNVLDLGAHGDDIQRLLTLFIQVTTALESDTSDTLTVSLCTGATTACGTTLWTSATIAKASLVAGYEIAKMPLPPGLLRYAKLVYTVGTGPFHTGKVDAMLAYGTDLP